MGFWIVLALQAGLYVLGKLLQPRPKRGKREQPEFPTADEGRPIPVVWGTCLIDAPNVVWYGDISISNASSGGSPYHKYYLGAQYAICHGPVDALIEVRWDGRNIFPAPEALGPDPIDHVFDSPALFGGTGAAEEGGVSGPMRFYFGSLDQAPDDYLVAKIGGPIPAHQGICYSVLRHMYLGNVAYMKPHAYVVRRCPNQLGVTSGHQNIGGDANPACMIYEALTDPRWGLGISPGLIDVATFRAVGEVLWTESFGLSLKLTDQNEGRAVIEDICQHIDGLVFTDPSTGLLTIVLARGDYDPLDLPLLAHPDVLSCEFSRPTFEATRNTVKISYTDRADDFVEKQASAQDLANIQAQSGVVALEELEFLGISNAALAQRVAARELKTRSYPLAPINLTVNRKAWGLKPGSPFRLTWPPLGIAGMPCRVNRISSGTLLEGQITIEAVEDIFAVTWTGYAPVPSTAWVDPTGLPPGPPAATDLHAMPYELVRGSYDPGRLPSGLALFARDPDSFTRGFRIYYLRADASWGFKTVDELTPYGVLAADLTPWGTQLDITPVVDVEVVASATDDEFLSGRNLLILAPPVTSIGSLEAIGRTSEVIAFRDIAPLGGSAYRLTTVSRGCLDTVPRSFPAGTRVWFVSYGSGRISTDRPGSGHATTTIDAKFAPFNLLEFEDWALEPLHQLIFVDAPPGTYSDREDLPYPPANVKTDGISYPTNLDGQLELTWDHRDRLGTWDYGDSGATTALETAAVYVLRVYDENNVLRFEDIAYTSNAFTWSLASEVSASGLGRANGSLRVVLFTIRPAGVVANSLNSWEVYDHRCDCSGWGMLWGNWWGGTKGRDEP